LERTSAPLLYFTVAYNSYLRKYNRTSLICGTTFPLRQMEPTTIHRRLLHNAISDGFKSYYNNLILPAQRVRLWYECVMNYIYTHTITYLYRIFTHRCKSTRTYCHYSSFLRITQYLLWWLTRLIYTTEFDFSFTVNHHLVRFDHLTVV